MFVSDLENYASECEFKNDNNIVDCFIFRPYSSILISS